ncbi:hypothetical protein FOZ60_002578 [Perkinsus olseni]|uniref:Uncharacterized protein n=1 Tax=Perkinsus olseni TaxID=32597 RepID=A0A7J6NYH1_PEROL|nr:hypothetical protein FOZ60_002578 [Perkinsus olseni]
MDQNISSAGWGWGERPPSISGNWRMRVCRVLDEHAPLRSFRNGQQKLDAARLKDHRGRTWSTSTVEGVAEDIHKHFGEVNPFDHFLEEIKEKYQSPMTELKCKSLFAFIENHPPEDYDAGSEWIGTFVDSNIDEYTRRAQVWRRDHPPPRLEDLKGVIV